jgi:SAM-dependent methyltransferase
MGEDPNLNKAYAIESLDEAKALYRDWADSYDQTFAKALGYASPRRIAEIFLSEYSNDGRILDIGAGTGLLAENLPGLIVDGIDISPEMLEVAKSKGLYRQTIVADLTRPLKIQDEKYDGLVSSGTFTHGHVGPACLPELLRIAKPGAIFCCSVVPDVFDAAGFGSALALLVAKRQISPVRFVEFNLYEDVKHEHDQDTGLAMVFHKTPQK